jgi:sulfane dehydrogenase subunit SoxC
VQLEMLDMEVLRVERTHDLGEAGLSGVEPNGDATWRRNELAEALEELGNRAAAVLARGNDLDRRPAYLRLERIRRALGDDLTVVDDSDPIGKDIGFLEVLRGQEDRDAVLAREPTNLVPQRCATLDVKARGRLVEEQDARTMDERHGEIEATLHAAGVAAHLAIGRVAQADTLEQLHRAWRALGARERLEGSLEQKMLAAGEQRIERRLLQRGPDVAAHRGTFLDDVVAAHSCRPGGRGQERSEHKDRRRLAGAVRTEEAVDLACPDMQIDAVNRSRPFLELSDEMLGLDRVRMVHSVRLASRRQDPRAPERGPCSVRRMEAFSQVELQLAARNHGMPLEALRYPLTPDGLHYVLIHYDIPAVDHDAFRLQIDGEVSRPLSFSLDELRVLPAREVEVTLECAGNGRALLAPRPLSQPWLSEAVGNAAWLGVPLASLLESARPRSSAVEVVFTGLDRGFEGGEEQAYARSLPLEDALGEDVLLAYGMNGTQLLPQHGAPLRLVVPGWYGMASVKWLTRITVVERPFEGYQQLQAYRLRRTEDEDGVPLTRILPRALMIPPGLPDFPMRTRTLRPGPCTIEGRAWSGWAPVETVEISIDGGATWTATELEPPTSRWAWRRWQATWDATPGEHVLCCRAGDGAGNIQPVEADWNVGGYANNGLQRVPVTVA